MNTNTACFYALAPAKGGNHPKSPATVRTSWTLRRGTSGTWRGTLDDKRSPSLAPIDPITCEDLGNVGNVGNLIPSSREENSLSHTNTRITGERATQVKESPENVPNVPHVPLKSATETKDSHSVRGTFDADVPLTFPQGSPADDPDVIDLATLPDADAAEPP